MAEYKWSRLVALLAGFTMLVAACGGGEETSTDDAGESDPASDGTAEADSDTEGETSTDDEAAAAAQSDDEDEPEAKGDGGDECLIGKWEADGSAFDDMFEGILAAFAGDASAPDMEMAAEGSQSAEFRADGTMTSVSDTTVTLSVSGEGEIVADGSTTVEAGWTVDGNEITITVNDINLDMTMTMGETVIPLGEVPPGGIGESNTATFDCSGDTLTAQSNVEGFQLATEMTRVG